MPSFQKEPTSSAGPTIAALSSKVSSSKGSTSKTSTSKPGPRASEVAKQQSFPKKGDVISIKESSTWKSAKVIGHAGKASGKNKSWFNLENKEDKTKVAIDLNEFEWKQLPDTPEEVNIVIIPKNQQCTPECDRAKLEEIEKLQQFNTSEVKTKVNFEYLPPGCFGKRMVVYVLVL